MKISGMLMEISFQHQHFKFMEQLVMKSLKHAKIAIFLASRVKLSVAFFNRFQYFIIYSLLIHLIEL